VSRVLLADIGGTYARFAVASGRTVGEIWATEVSAHRDIVDAIAAFSRAGTPLQGVEGALIAAAGPVEGGRCKLTNAAWTIDEDTICTAFHFGWARIVNDLEAIAAGLPDLAPAHLREIGSGTAVPGAPMAIVAPGTGLGVGCLLLGPGGRSVLASEGGHASLASFLRRKHDHVSAERVLSGGGLSDLHQAFASFENESALRLPPSEVTARAFDGSSPACRAAIDAFCELLGAFAGDVALMFGARGGVFIGGGIVPRFADHLVRSDFRTHFEAKGRMHAYVQRIRTNMILHPNPAFIGLLNLVPAAPDRVRRLPVE
jgi:glucokinase